METQIIGIVVAVLAASVPVVRAWVKTKLTPTRLAHVANIARMAVGAAEELGKLVPAGTNIASAKLDFAAGVVAKESARLGIKLTQDEVLAFIHSALHDVEEIAKYHVPTGL